MADTPLNQDDLFERLDKIADNVERIRDYMREISENTKVVADSTRNEDSSSMIQTEMLDQLRAINVTVGNQASGGADP